MKKLKYLIVLVSLMLTASCDLDLSPYDGMTKEQLAQ